MSEPVPAKTSPGTSARLKPRQVIGDPVLFLAFGFGSGLSPKAPGTSGSLLALVAMPLLAGLSAAVYLVFLAVVAGAGIWICGRAADKLGVHDHPGIVWDEFAGLWLALVFCPPQWVWWLAGFVLFRFFDIVKPWPIRWLDRRCPGGLGIMVDDLLAGVFAGAVLQAGVFLSTRWMGV